ncbi:expressed unknown protein [Seminavis robusta]|uniref:Uncharacterized protein n=1 Tax=Seminavis robusta TaxID=568900 RepID=A0A9N8HJS6_9STRA|nr:expressed unknown protein [Seminavis robusta]|eukprot:Sro683_g186620.1 n/a (485) ;mRNA; r:16209-17663
MGYNTAQDKQGRSVAFSKKQRVKAIPSLCYYDAEDVEALWYSRKEVESFSLLADELIVLVESGEIPANGPDHSMRGLERKTEEGNTESFMNRVGVYNAVLDEQDAQLIKGQQQAINWDKIAQLSQRASKDATVQAIKRGKQDQADIQAYQKETTSSAANSSKPSVTPSNRVKASTATPTSSRTSRSQRIKQSTGEPELTLSDVFAKTNSKKKSNDSWITASTSSLSSFEEDESAQEKRKSAAAAAASTPTSTAYVAPGKKSGTSGTRVRNKIKRNCTFKQTTQVPGRLRGAALASAAASKACTKSPVSPEPAKPAVTTTTKAVAKPITVKAVAKQSVTTKPAATSQSPATIKPTAATTVAPPKSRASVSPKASKRRASTATTSTTANVVRKTTARSVSPSKKQVVTQLKATKNPPRKTKSASEATPLPLRSKVLPTTTSRGSKVMPKTTQRRSVPAAPGRGPVATTPIPGRGKGRALDLSCVFN